MTLMWLQTKSTAARGHFDVVSVHHLA